MTGIRYIDPLKDLGGALLGVEKPARYTGGEYGSLADRDGKLRMAIAFPDLYEIGMSNQALRILYNGLNRIPGVSCDRAFVPAPDFEALLRERGLPLYGLDTGIPLGNLDILCFTLGYELGITGVLAMLDAAGVPLRVRDRKNDHPLVVMGGPCVSNPLPYARFIDVFWIGEAEAGFFELIRRSVELKKAGKGRAALGDLFLSHPSVWAPGKKGAVRAVDAGFALREPEPAVFPVPSIKVIQHHGAVEIMRGCPNGCRFCHAGIWYRPMRQKSAGQVCREAAAFIKTGGYREISLSSLSSGDYVHLDGLAASLNREYAPLHVSFQLPSLRVSTFSLSLLKEISEVRKSGLTFAVETPVDAWQMAINKRVSLDTVTAILQDARKQGWRGAKFYFMVGLPLPQESVTEEDAISKFIIEAARRSGMHFNVNVGTFVPKSHTPYQWSAQIDEETARIKLEYIRRKLKPLGHKVGIHDPFTAKVEGVLSRGGQETGAIIEEAYLGGCRLDAWDEYLRKDIWKSIFEKYSVETEIILGTKDPSKPLPWDVINPGISSIFLRRESEASKGNEITSSCMEKCTHLCGTCKGDTGIVSNTIQLDVKSNTKSLSGAKMPPWGLPEDRRNTGSAIKPGTIWRDIPAGTKDPITHRILFSFSKEGRAVFLPHLGVTEVFSMAFLRAGLPALYSRGFNPLPKISFASPLALGIAGEAEIATVDMEEPVEGNFFLERINPALPQGLCVRRAIHVLIPPGAKKHSASSLLWGFIYRAGNLKPERVPFKDERAYRAGLGGTMESLFDLRRTAVLAAAIGSGMPDSYFDVYTSLYDSQP
ncbi:MAG: TIGR03936 family radical SAM-associated protein [Treponema sp.]|nr:TIGR03936 family radical SAM-associated protein [Treponema sp.]